MNSNFAAPNRAKAIPDDTGRWLLEERQPFDQSMLWSIQRRYFEERGADAWRLGEVPHYATCNSFIAGCYAELILAFWRDRQRLAPGEGPLTVVELGGGSGRLAFHLLRRLGELCESEGLPPGAIRYVLTDFAANNLAAWRAHPGFIPFLADGRLDLARFDITESQELRLERSGETLGPGGLRAPLVAIANYFFDSIPQRLFRVRNGRLQVCDVTLSTDLDPAGLDPAALIEQIRIEYGARDCPGPPTGDPDLDRLLQTYRRELEDAYLLFPEAGLRGLRRLHALSVGGLLLLTADKGQHRLDRVGSNEPPRLVEHGSFSLSVNYHALAAFCEQAGGVALRLAEDHAGLDVLGLLMVENAGGHAEIRRAWRRVRDFGPEDYLRVSKHGRQTGAHMDLPHILAHLRLGHYDSHALWDYLPCLLDLAAELDEDERGRLRQAMARTWPGNCWRPIPRTRRRRNCWRGWRRAKAQGRTGRPYQAAARTSGVKRRSLLPLPTAGVDRSGRVAGSGLRV